MFRTRTPQAVPDSLLSVPHLAGCPREELAVLGRISTLVTVEPGRVLCVEGGPAAEAFLVLDGEVEVLVHGQCVARVGPGGFVGEMGLIERAARSATVVATTTTALLAMTRAELATLLADAPTLTRTMMADIATRLRVANERV